MALRGALRGVLRLGKIRPQVALLCRRWLWGEAVAARGSASARFNRQGGKKAPQIFRACVVCVCRGGERAQQGRTRACAVACVWNGSTE